MLDDHRTHIVAAPLGPGIAAAGIPAVLHVVKTVHTSILLVLPQPIDHPAQAFD